MEQTLSELHPNPGWGAPEIHATDMVGKHCILELYDCDPSRLDDEAFIRTTITSAAKGAGATLLNLITHQFQPQGVTGLALLAESHILDSYLARDPAMPPWMCSPAGTTPCRSRLAQRCALNFRQNDTR